MLTDILFSIYIIMLFPFLYECEKLENKGLKFLLLGVILTPIVGYIVLLVYRRKYSSQNNSFLSKS